jgi:hypothetical protein
LRFLHVTMSLPHWGLLLVMSHGNVDGLTLTFTRPEPPEARKLDSADVRMMTVGSTGVEVNRAVPKVITSLTRPCPGTLRIRVCQEPELPN